MKGFLAIVIRELKDRRAVFAAAGFAALIPVLVPFAPGIGWSSVSDVRELVAVCMALGLGWILALFLGAGMIGGDLVQGRLGFYFSRPVSGSSIWLGKVMANVLLVVAAEMIIFLPAFVFFGADPFFAFNSANWWVSLDLLAGGPMPMIVALLVAVPILLLLLSHAIGIMWRARSPWIALDAAFFVALSMVLWLRLAPLAIEAPLAVMVISGVLLLSVPAVLFLAGWAQVSFGRTDIQRGHRVLSGVLWGVLGSATVVAIGFGAWVTAVDPDDMVSVEAVRPSTRGPWIEVTGKVSGRFDFRPHFLLNRETGAFLRLSSADWWSDSVVFSLDGKRVAWLDPIGFDQRQLVFADLGDERPVPRETPLTFRRVHRLVLSDRGDRVVVFEKGTLSVYDLETGKLLIATRFEYEGAIRMARFISDEVFRVITGAGRWLSGPQPGEIVEVDISSGSVEKTGRVDPDLEGMDDVDPRTWRSRFAYDFQSHRYCMIEGVQGKFRMTIRNGRTGEMEVDLGSHQVAGHALWSSDGRLIRAFVKDGQGWVEVWQADGLSSQKWPAGPAGRLIPSGEAMPGEFSFALHPDSLEYDAMELRGATLNIDTGVVRQIEGARYPAAGWWMVYFGASSGGRLWFGEGWTLMEWDPVSGTTRHLLGNS